MAFRFTVLEFMVNTLTLAFDGGRGYELALGRRLLFL